MEHCVRVGEKGVLDLDLRGQQVREQRKCDGNELRQVLSEVFVHCIVFLMDRVSMYGKIMIMIYLQGGNTYLLGSRKFYLCFC